MSYRSRLDKKTSSPKLKWTIILGIAFISLGIYLLFEFEDNNKKQNDQAEIIDKQEVKIPKPEQDNDGKIKDETKDNTSVEIGEPAKKKNADTSEENANAKHYSEAATSIYNIIEYMNTIYVEADELRNKFTPYDENNSFSYIGKTDLENLYYYSKEISNEVTASSHFKQPSYTVPGFRQTVESNRIIVRELDQLKVLIEQYPRKFQEDPESTLDQAQGHLERIKIASQSKLPGFEKLFKPAGNATNQSYLN